ncbi:MAG: ribose 5-phosphate isomerase B [Acholeplasmataceae bacterium]|nr:ribose 5-phosphate isomerase B [Acholeplasmataceae bacterium]
MKICIGCDHGGFLLKEQVKKYLENKYGQIIDMGCYSEERCDYPVFAKKVASAVQNHECDFGVLICTTGIGVSICANKFKGVRAALVTNEDVASLSRNHNNSNIICLGAKYTSYDEAIKYIDIFLNAKFEGGRHERRVAQIEN